MFSLFNKLIFEKNNRFKILIVMLGLFVTAGSSAWGDNYTLRDEGALDSTWDSTIWKKQTLVYMETNEYPAQSASNDNVYLTAKYPVKLTLTGDISLSEFTVGFNGGALSPRENEIIIDLAGFSFTVDKLTLNNNDGVNTKLTFINSAATPASVTVDSFDYSDNKNHKLTIGSGVTFTTNNYSPTTGTGSITIVEDTPGSFVDNSGNAATDSGRTPADDVTWLGLTTDWSDLNNWSGIYNVSQLKDVKTVTIPAGVPNYPVTTAATNVTLNGTLIIEDGATVTFNGTADINKINSPDGTIITSGTDLKIRSDSTLKTLTTKATTDIAVPNPLNFTVTTLNVENGKNANITPSISGTGTFTATEISIKSNGAYSTTLETYISRINVASGNAYIYSNANLTIGIACNAQIKNTEFTGGETTYSSTLEVKGKLSGTSITNNIDNSSDRPCIVNASQSSSTITVSEIKDFGTPSGVTKSITGKGKITCDSVSGNTNIRAVIGMDAGGELTCPSITNCTINNSGVITTGTIDTRLGGAGDVANITNNAGGTLVFNDTADFSVTGNVVNKGTISLSGKGGTFTGTFDSSTGTFNGSTSANPEIIFNSSSLKLGSNFKPNNDTVKLAHTSDCTFTSNAVLKSVIIDSTANVKLNSDLSAENLTIENGTLTTASGKNITLTGSWTNNAGSAAYSYTTSSTVTVAKDVTGSTKFYDLIINGTGTSNISGANTVDGTFTCSAAGKTIAFEAGTEQTINELEITGVSGNEIILTSQTPHTPWEIKIPAAANPDVRYVKVQDSTATGSSIKTLNSQSVCHTTGWIFTGTYRWTGATDSTWDDVSNWQIKTGSSSWAEPASTPGKFSDEDEVIISQEFLTGTDYPEFSSSTDISLKTIKIGDADNNGELTVSAAGSLLISDTSNSSCFGTVTYKNTGRLKESAGSLPISDPAHGTIVFDGATTIDTLAATSYYFNIVTKNDIENTDATFDLVVNGTASIKGKITTAGSQIYKGEVTLAGNSSFVAGTNTVTFNERINQSGTSHSLTIGDTGNANKTNAVFKKAVSNVTVLTVYGNTTNEISITTTGTQTFNGTVTNKGTISSGALQTYNGAVSGAGTIKVPNVADGTDGVIFNGGYTGGTLTGSTATNPNIVFAEGTVKFGTVNQNSDNIKFAPAAGKSCSFNSNGKTLSKIEFAGPGTTTLASPLNVTATGNTGVLTLSGGTLACGNNDIEADNWTHTGGTFTPGTGTVTVSKNVSGTNDFNNLILSGNLTGNHTIESLTINGSGTTEISGDNTITDFTCSTGGKTVTFTTGTTQTLTGTFTVSGTSANPVTLKSKTDGTQWDIDTTGATSTVSYTKVQDSNSAIEITATDSLSLGNNVNWIIPGTYEWTGNSSDDWNLAANWNVKQIDETFAAADTFPGESSSSDIVTIATITSGNDPDFSGSSITIKSLTISNADRVLTLSGTGDILVNDGTISNSGTVTYTNTGRIKNNASPAVTISDVTKGTVKFADTATTIDDTNSGAGTDYYNLIIASDASFTGTTLKVAGAINSDSASSNRNLTINGNLNSSSIGNISSLNRLSVSGSFDSNSGSVTCTDAISIGGNATFRGNIQASSISVTGSTVFGQATRSVTTSGTQTYNGAATINSTDETKTLTLIAGTAGTPSTVTFNSTVDAYVQSGVPTETAQLIIGSNTIKSDAQFKNNIGETNSLENFTLFGNADFDSAVTSVNTLVSQTYKGNVNGSTISFKSEDSGTAGTVVFENTVTATSIDVTGKTTNAGTITTTGKQLYYNIVNNSGTINSGDTQTYTGAVANTGTINVPAITSGTAIEFKDGLSGAGSLIGAKTSAAVLTPNPDIVFSGGTVVLGTFTQNDDNLKFAPAAGKTCSFNSNGITLSKVEFAGNGTTTLASDLKVNITGNTAVLTLSGGTLASGNFDITADNWSHTGGTFTPGTATVTVNRDVSGTNEFNNLILSGNLSGNHSAITSLTIQGTGTTEIDGNNTITNFTCQTPDKKISFKPDSTQTITKLTLNGQAEDTPVILNSTDGISEWNISVNNDATSDIRFTHIKNSVSDKTGGTKTISTHLCKNLGNNTRWIFAEDYIWYGTSSAEWNNNSNWKVKIGATEFNAVTYPGESSQDDTVTIKNVTTKPEYSGLTSGATATVSKLTIDASSSLTLNSAADLKIKQSTAGLSNSGTIIYSNQGRIKNNVATAVVIADSTKGSVQFSGTATIIDDIASGTTPDYYNLIVKNAAELSDDIITNGTIEIASTGSVTGNSHDLKTATGKNATVSGAITEVKDFSAGGNLIQTATISSSTVTVSGTSSIGANITTTGNQTYTGSTTLNKASLTFEAGTGNLIIFTGDVINGAGINCNLSINSGDVKFGNAGTNASRLGAVIAKGEFSTTAAKSFYASSLEVTGKTTNSGTITTTGNQTYTGAVTNTGTINVPAITSGTAIEFKGGLSGAGSLIGAKTSAAVLTPNPDIVFSGGTVVLGTFTQNDDNLKFAPPAGKTCSFNSNGITLSKVEFAGNGTTTLASDLKVNITGNTAVLTLSGGTLASGNFDITADNWSHTDGTFTPGTATVTVNRDVSGTNEFNNLTVSRDLNGNHAINGTLKFTGTGESKITGSNTITNFECSTASKILTFTAGTTQTINSSLILNGATGNEITLKSNSSSSTSAADQWTINTTGASTEVKFVKVQNSNSTKLILTQNSASLGNNVNWGIASKFKWVGSGADSDWKTPDNWVTVYGTNEYKTNEYPGAFGASGIFDEVEISSTNIADNWPDFAETTTSLILSKIQIGTNGQLVLSGTKDLHLAATSSPLSNAGEITYKNDGRIKNNAVPSSPVMDITKGLVIFSENAKVITNINTREPSTTIEPADYFNLKVENDMTLGGCITVANNFELLNNKNISATTDGYRFIVRKESSIGGNITTTDLQKYQGKVTLTDDVTLMAKNAITFDTNAVIQGDFSLTFNSDTDHKANYELKKNATVKTLTANIAAGKTFSIPASVTVTAKEGFTVTGAGAVSLGTDSASTVTTIKTENTDINFSGTGTVTLHSQVSLSTDTDNGSVTLSQPFAGTTANMQKLTISAGKGNVLLNNNIGSSALPLGDIIISGTQITAGENIIINSGATINVASTDLFRTLKGAAITANGGFTKTGNGLSQIAGTFTTSDKAISFSTDTFVDNVLTFDTTNGGAVATPTAVISVGSGSEANLFISALDSTNAALTVTVKTKALNVTGNIAVFNGKVVLNADMTSGKDIILLNGTASTMYNDNRATVSSGKTGLFDYHNSLRTTGNKLCPPSLVYKAPGSATPTASKYPELMPDGTTAIGHTNYSSTLSGFAGKTITASQNFYDNGVNLTSALQWTLKLKDNDSATNAFAELYKATISNCKVECITAGGYAWLSASEATDGTNNASDTAALLTYSGDNRGTYSRTMTGVAFLYPVLLKNNSLYSASEGRKTGPEIPNLSGTYSVRDNVIRVEFVRSNDATKTALIENSNNEITRALKAIKLNNKNSSVELTAYIDAECTEPTDGKGDIAVFYIKADGIKWNLIATGTNPGSSSDYDSDGVHQNNTTDMEIKRVMDDLFYTITDEHKNRIASYSANPTETPSSKPGFRFTATETRCAIGEMHITFAIADFTSNKIYLYFDNPLADNITWKTFDPTVEDDKKTESAIKIISAPGSTSYKAEYEVESVSRTGISENGIILTLKKDLDYSMIQDGIVIKYGGTFLFNNKIHSPDNKVVLDGESHCISDVITNCVDVQYAYDDRNDAYIESTGGIAAADSIATRDFTGEGRNNKVFADKNITLVTKDISGNPQFKYKLIADITPALHSDGELYPAFSGHNTRFWFAEGNNPVTSFSPTLNNSANKKNSVDNSDLITQTIDADDNTLINYYFHNFSEESPCLNWQTGSNVRFLFEVLKGDGSSYTINHKYDGPSLDAGTEVTPLYLARLKKPADPTSIDLWSFLITEPQRQRGGVSIYSNVVNATSKEFCTLEVNMAKAGSLRVIVMTADGNVVTYLENGRQSEGLHYYYWHGTNNAGNAVARGIYFIRVVGPDIDETRKVMVVK